MAIKTNTRKDYLERINKVLIYVHDHLEENLEIEKLSSISNFSPYHFHRILSAHLHEPLGSYILRLRLDKAAVLLELSKDPVSDIAYKVGYDSPSSFSKAFKKRFKVSPNDFRQVKNEINLDLQIANFNIMEKNMELKAKIKKIKPKKVIFISKIGAYDSDETSIIWEKICAFASKNKLWGFKPEFIGISHDDPNITETEKLRYDACITVRKEIKPEGEVGFKEIKGGNYAIFRHLGSYKNFNETYNYIYRKWLPESGYELADAPCFEHYLNSPDKTPENKLATDIYLPIV